MRSASSLYFLSGNIFTGLSIGTREATMGWMADETGLGKCAANYEPLTPLSFLDRAKGIYTNELAVVYGTHRKT